MSPRSSEKKPKTSSGASPAPDVYVGLLFVAVAALVAGCIFLALELEKYGWQMATP
jgi:hypothetical protein